MQLRTNARTKASLLIGAATLLLVANNVNCRTRSYSVSSHSPHRPADSAPSADVARSRERDLRWVENSVRLASYSLHSQRPYREVQVPLTFRNGMPFVRVSWGGRKIECLVDTGTEQIMWPQWLQLKGSPLSVSGRIAHVIGRPTRAQWIVASDISLGGFSIRNLATLAMDVPRKGPSVRQTLEFPILGLQTFNGVILTVDYAHTRLILRDPNYFLNVSRQKHSPQAQLMSFPAYDSSPITVPGIIAGHKALFLLDTGCYYPVVILDTFARKFLRVVTNRTDTHNGLEASRTTGQQGQPRNGVHDIAGSILGQPFTIPWTYTTEIAAPGDALLGSPWFMRHQVTIDQGRHVVLIEPNAP